MTELVTKRARFRICYSLATLLWLSLAAGTAMMCWSRKEWRAWGVTGRIVASKANWRIDEMFTGGLGTDPPPSDKRPRVPAHLYESGFVPHSRLVYVANCEPPDGKAYDIFNPPPWKPWGVCMFNRDGTFVAKIGSHESEIKSVQFSRDGRRMLSISREKACVWDVGKRELIQELRVPMIGEGGFLEWMSGVFSPDGGRLALSDALRGTTVFDANSGAVVLHIFNTAKPEKSAGEQWSLEQRSPIFSDDGRWLLLRVEVTRCEGLEIAEGASDVTLFNLNSGQAELAERFEAKRDVVAAAFRADGTAVLVDWDGATHHARVREVDARKNEMREYKWRIEGATRGICFAGGARVIVCRMKDGLNVYDSTTGALLYHREERLKGCDVRWDISADGTRWRSLDDRGLAVWDLKGNRFIERYSCPPADEREAEGYKLFESDPFRGPGNDAWTRFSVQSGMRMQFDENEQALLEPVPSGIRVWEKQYTEGWLGFLLLPEVIFATLLSGMLAWRTARLLREAARRERPPWYWWAVRGTWRALRGVSVETWVLAAATAGSGWMLWRSWGPYEMAREFPQGSVVWAIASCPRAVEIDEAGHVRIWDAVALRAIAELKCEPEPKRTEYFDPFQLSSCANFDPYILLNKSMVWDCRTGKLAANLKEFGKVASIMSPSNLVLIEGAEHSYLYDMKELRVIKRLPRCAIAEAYDEWGLALFERDSDFFLYDLERLQVMAYLDKEPGFNHPELQRIDGHPRRGKDGDLYFQYRSQRDNVRLSTSVDGYDLDFLDERAERYRAEADLRLFDDAGDTVVQDDSRCIYFRMRGIPLKFSPDKRYAYMLSPIHELQQWRVEDGTFVRGLGRYTTDWLETEFIDDGRWVVAGGGTEKRADGALQIHDAESGERIDRLSVAGVKFDSHVAAFAGTRNLLVTAAEDDPQLGENSYAGPMHRQIWRLWRPATEWGFLRNAWFWVAAVCGSALVWRIVSRCSGRGSATV